MVKVKVGCRRLVAGEPDAAAAVARTGLPALVTVAGFDPLRDQGTAYAAALRRAGVRAEVIEEDALVHGYVDFAGLVPEARRAVDRIAAGIGGLLAG